MAAALIDHLGRLPAHLRRWLTWDRGSEMAQHAVITTALALPVLFCDPHHPWQRGTNENTNRLLRQYLHKNADPDHVHPGRRPQCRDLNAATLLSVVTALYVLHGLLRQLLNSGDD